MLAGAVARGRARQLGIAHDTVSISGTTAMSLVNGWTEEAVRRA
ncbi:MAG TPA: hypothetical protein VFD31_06775 [Thermoleophilaceae bacterium]|nr:hypothetical protein [Thermoleophilaceae bacterium]